MIVAQIGIYWNSLPATATACTHFKTLVQFVTQQHVDISSAEMLAI